MPFPFTVYKKKAYIPSHPHTTFHIPSLYKYSLALSFQKCSFKKMQLTNIQPLLLWRGSGLAARDRCVGLMPSGWSVPTAGPDEGSTDSLVPPSVQCPESMPEVLPMSLSDMEPVKNK